MKKMIVLVCFGLAFVVSAPAVAAGEKMKGCSKEATGMKGEERKVFMKKCLAKDYVLKSGAATDASADAAATTAAEPPASAAPADTAASSAQQGKMKTCNAEAKTKELKGDERKKFMSDCLKG
ncbi:MAG: PsiF family protein [Gallionella sp.]